MPKYVPDHKDLKDKMKKFMADWIADCKKEQENKAMNSEPTISEIVYDEDGSFEFVEIFPVRDERLEEK
jgi:thiol-disulfide isomerase/thioredoxin